MALLSLFTLFILLELQHCLPTENAEKVPEHTCTCNPGVPGTPGHNGLPGRDGKEGVAGQKGEKGDRGMMGARGHPGKFGPAGPEGPAGAPGPVGPEGPNGLMGPAGAAGPAGPAGVPGPVGPEGPNGLMGPVGPSGPTGEKGEPGPAGMMGARGHPGKFGPAGPAGPAGAPGPVGPEGPNGLMGPAGPSGPKGEKGEPGPAGPLPAINLVELQSELQTLKDVFNKREMELQTLKYFVNKITQFPFTRVGRKVFVTDKKTGTFDEAVKWCSSVGGVPALPTSLEENQALQGLVSGYTSAWLSANDRKTEGRFVDLQEKAIQFSKWGSGEPDGGGAWNCVVMYGWSGDWYDVPCEYTGNLIVCEI